MAFFLILGVIIGAAAIIFILQNVEPVTVAFFSYHLNGSLALILFLTLFAGMIATILILLPGFMGDSFLLSRLRKENKRLADELADTKKALADVASRPNVIQADSVTVI